MPLSHALEQLKTSGLLVPLNPTPISISKPLSHQFKKDEYCDFHQNKGHNTDQCFKLRHEIQDLIDQGVITFPKHTNYPNVLKPLPIHTNPFHANIAPGNLIQSYTEPPKLFYEIKREFPSPCLYHPKDIQDLISMGFLHSNEQSKTQIIFEANYDQDDRNAMNLENGQEATNMKEKDSEASEQLKKTMILHSTQCLLLH